jgi:hypothetical protein
MIDSRVFDNRAIADGRRAGRFPGQSFELDRPGAVIQGGAGSPDSSVLEMGFTGHP